ncbi:MAG: exodeoxyribonuclease V subunit gamma [Desulfobacterales bacterium]|nr:exodeoxyribonuclease V subunit gamma [Desulfobacterales bacterium]
MEKLFPFAASLEETRDLAGWASHLGAALDTFFLADGEEEEDLQALRRALADMALLQSQSGFDQQPGAGVLKAHLEEALREVGLGFGFITGGITFCAMLPMRSIPFRVICLIGLDDGAYPRQTRVPGFDLMKERPALRRPIAQARRPVPLSRGAALGPPDVLHQLRGAEHPGQQRAAALGSGERAARRDRAGLRDAREEHRRRHRHQAPPAGLQPRVLPRGEAFQLLRRECCGGPFGRRRPPGETALHPRKPRRAAACVAKHRRPGPRPVLRQPRALAAQPQAGHPPRRGRGVSRRRGAHGPRRPRELRTGRAARGAMPRRARGEGSAARREGPGKPSDGDPGECGFQEICEGVEAFAARLRPHLTGEPLGAVDLDCALGPFRLTGRLQLGSTSALVHYRYASIKAKDLLRSWIHHLALSARGSGRYPGRCVIIGQDGGYVLEPVADAESILLGLLEIYWRGLTRPLHFFPDTARAYAEALRKGRTQRGSPESRPQQMDDGLRLCRGGRPLLPDVF